MSEATHAQFAPVRCILHRCVRDAHARRMHGAVCTHDSRAYAYGTHPLLHRLSEGELGANMHFAESWLEAIGNSTRMAPYTQKKAALVDGFQQVSAAQQCRNAGCAACITHHLQRTLR